MKKCFLIICSIFLLTLCTAQVDKNNKIFAVNSTIDTLTSNVLTFRNPLRASLYSAILPGTGQAYNKKWWKVPIVWGLLGVGGYMIYRNNNEYRKFRDAYIASLYGLPNNYKNLSPTQLGNIQDDRKRTRDYTIALTILAYLLNVIDATVDAHLYGVDKDPDIGISPTIIQDLNTFEPKFGISLNLKF